MKRKNFCLHGKIKYLGTDFEIVAINPPKVSLQRKNGDMESIEVSLSELVSHPSFQADKSAIIGKDVQFFRSRLDSLSDFQRAIVSNRRNWVIPLILLEKIKKTIIEH